MGILPFPRRQVCGKALPVIFPHGVQVAIHMDCLLHDGIGVAVMSPKDQRRLLRESRLPDPLLHRRDDGLQEPVRLVLGSPEGLTQADHKADMGEGLDELHNGLVGIVGIQFGDIALEQFHMVFFCQGQGNVYAVEFQHQPDAPAVTLPGKPSEHLPVLLILFLCHLQGLRVICQFHQGGKGLPRPDVKYIAPGKQHLIQKPLPQGLVIEPGKTGRGNGILIGQPGRLHLGELQPYRRAPETEYRGVPVGQVRGHGI